MKERNEKQEKEKIPKRGENPKGNKESQKALDPRVHPCLDYTSLSSSILITKKAFPKERLLERESY